MKRLKMILTLALASSMLLTLSSCLFPIKKGGSVATDETGEQKTSAAETAASEPASAEPAKETKKADRPKADGIEKHIYDLYFYVPEGTADNPYNGMLGVWEFYTEDLDKPGVDIMVQVNGLNGKSALDYVKNDSRPARSNGVSPVAEETINGFTFYTCNNGTIYYFGGAYDDTIYEIEVKASKGGDPKNLRQTAMDLLRKTLYFES